MPTWRNLIPSRPPKTEELETRRLKEHVGKCESSKPSSNIPKPTFILIETATVNSVWNEGTKKTNQTNHPTKNSQI